MKIVNLETFRALPEWTVFRKYQPCITEDIQFKFETLDFDFVSMSVDMPESNRSEQLFDRLDEMLETGASYPMQTDGAQRDGLFEPDQLFLVYEHADLVALRGLLDNAVKVAAGEEPDEAA